jgi:hypothetical protein
MMAAGFSESWAGGDANQSNVIATAPRWAATATTKLPDQRKTSAEVDIAPPLDQEVAMAAPLMNLVRTLDQLRVVINPDSIAPIARAKGTLTL